MYFQILNLVCLKIRGNVPHVCCFGPMMSSMLTTSILHPPTTTTFDTLEEVVLAMTSSYSGIRHEPGFKYESYIDPSILVTNMSYSNAKSVTVSPTVSKKSSLLALYIFTCCSTWSDCTKCNIVIYLDQIFIRLQVQHSQTRRRSVDVPSWKLIDSILSAATLQSVSENILVSDCNYYSGPS